jgi:hypothetical protein
MKASDIIQGLAHLLSGLEGNQQTATAQPPTVVVVNNTPAQPNTSPAVDPMPVAPMPGKLAPVKTDDAGNQDQPDLKTMVPPLQQKIELLKKSTNVDNAFDQADNSTNSDDELARMKKMAGINTVVTHELAKDEPLDI